MELYLRGDSKNPMTFSFCFCYVDKDKNVVKSDVFESQNGAIDFMFYELKFRNEWINDFRSYVGRCVNDVMGGNIDMKHYPKMVLYFCGIGDKFFYTLNFSALEYKVNEYMLMRKDVDDGVYNEIRCVKWNTTFSRQMGCIIVDCDVSKDEKKNRYLVKCHPHRVMCELSDGGYHVVNDERYVVNTKFV